MAENSIIGSPMPSTSRRRVPLTRGPARRPDHRRRLPRQRLDALVAPGRDEVVSAIATTLMDSYDIVHLPLAASYAASGRTEAARATMAAFLERKPRYSVEKIVTGLPYRDRAALDRLVEHLRAVGLPDHPPS